MADYVPELAIANMHAKVRGLPSGWKLIGAVERLAALVMLVLALPGLFLAGLMVVLLSRRCPLVAHPRVGLHGKEIWVLKLRTMWPGTAGGRSRFLVERLTAVPAPEAKRPGDPRVTSAFAAVCRKYSIDELPQLWNVAKGEMALVGPRPMMRDELRQHYGPAAGEIIRVRPGLTGLWQTRGRSSLNYRQRRRLDLFLLRKWSFRLYAAVLLVTIPRVLTGRNAW